jgi:hypothetical protein
MKRYIPHILLLNAIIFFTGMAFADDGSEMHERQNISYQIMKIKHRANREFTNNGRVSYQYTTDTYVDQLDSFNYGAVVVDRRSKVQKVYNAVELFDRHHIEENKDQTVGIGTVSDYSGNLKQAETYVRIVKPIKF